MTRDPDQARLRYSHHVVTSEAHRLVLFTIPKAGCTELLRLSRRMAGHDDWRTHPHYADRPFLARCAPERIDMILADPSWSKAALLRDPAERLLSAYLDKFIRRPGPIANSFRPDGFGMEFEEFLHHVLHPNADESLPFGLHAGTNPHWRPQALIGGIGHHVNQLSDVADFEDAGQWIRRLLTQVGAWDEFGSTGWGSEPADGDPANEDAAVFEQNTAFNRTDARTRIREFYDQTCLDAVYDAYEIDLELGRHFHLNLRHHTVD